MTRRTEITIETHRRLVVRRSGGSLWDQCIDCNQQVQMITPSEAAAMAGVTVRTINRWVENGVLHFAETKEGLLLICPNFPRTV